MQFNTSLLAAITTIAMIQPLVAGGFVKKIFTGKRSIESLSERDTPAGDAAYTCLEHSEGPNIHVIKGAKPNSWSVHGVPDACEGIVKQLQADKSHGTITIVGGDKNTVNIEDMPPAQVPAFLQWASQHP